MGHLLVIDKDAKLRNRVSRHLEGMGHSVAVASDSLEARSEAGKQRPDLVIADHMPGQDGSVDFLVDLEQDESLNRLPVILLVDGRKFTAALRTYNCDLFALIKKPVDLSQLGAQVETALRHTMRRNESRVRERESLQKRIGRLEREIKTTTEDLTDAAQNFVTMLAAPPTVKGFRIDCHYAPCGGFVGGDFYNFFWLDSRRLAVVAGDVSGHGIQAAVIQSMARKVLSIALKQTNGDLREALVFANDEIASDIPTGKFVAAFAGILDTRSGHWTHARCGFPHPVLLKANGDVQEILTPGPALGLARAQDWVHSVGIYDTRLEPDSRLVLFSDGLLECVQESGEEFDYPGVSAALQEMPRDGDLAAGLIAAAKTPERARDDVLVIGITREPFRELNVSRTRVNIERFELDAFDFNA